MIEKTPQQRQVRQEQLSHLLSLLGPEQSAALLAIADDLRDSVLDSAEGIAAGHPEQLNRFLDGVAGLARSIEAITSHTRPVQKNITFLREAAARLGFGKFVNRNGRQESPED